MVREVAKAGGTCAPRYFSLVVLLCVLTMSAALTTSAARGVEIPVSGIEVPELAMFDTAMIDVMETNDISGGALAIMHNGVTVYQKSFGWSDENRTTPLPINTMMRLASVTKPLTAAAIRSLINDGAVGLHERVFDVDQPGTGILSHVPFGTRDVRSRNITVNHLLQHQGGWDRNAPGIDDYTYDEREIASDMGLPSPPGRDAMMRWILGQPLQFTPGTGSAYSNIGYLALGLVSEARTGMAHIDVMREKVFQPIGVPADQIVHGRTFAEDQDPREPYYDSDGSTAVNVFWPEFDSDFIVDRAYGGFDVESRIGQGGVVASPIAILKFLDNYQIAGASIGGPRPGPGNWSLTHTGAYTGTNTRATQRGDGINYVVLFNKRDGSSDAGAAINNILNSGVITDWPTEDVAMSGVLNGIEGDLNQDGLLNGIDIRLFADGWKTDSSFTGALGRYYRGDLDLNGMTDLTDLFLLHQSFQGTPFADNFYAILDGSQIPEPSTILLAACCLVGSLPARRTRQRFAA